MKLLTMLPFFLLLFVCDAKSQNTSWFYGTWQGETYFPDAPVTKRIVITLTVTNVSGSSFTATLTNLYPNDTTVRLEREITGIIENKSFVVIRSEQTYIRDPRTQNFWYDCTSCPTQSGFSINKDKVEIKITTINCGDICNGETIFSRDTSDFDSNQKTQLAEWLGLPANEEAVKSSRKSDSNVIDAISKDTVSLKKNDSAFIGGTMRKDSVKTALQPIKADTVTRADVLKNESIKDATVKPDIIKKDTLNPLTERTTSLINTFRVRSPHIFIQLYDNAEIDGDVVSVFYNEKLIVDHQSLTHKAISFAIDASLQNSHHEFILVAENLGLIPPNTALMRIMAGTQKFELEVSSDFTNNAKISIDYTGE